MLIHQRMCGIHIKPNLFPVCLAKTPSRAAKSVAMAPMFFAITLFFTVTSVSTHGFALDMVSPHRQCDSDHQCDDGFFCYDESHLCTRCVECGSYKRKSSWRSCPKTPSDCGACLSGHEEEILHEGKTRDMCIPSFANNLSHTNDFPIINGFFQNIRLSRGSCGLEQSLLSSFQLCTTFSPGKIG